MSRPTPSHDKARPENSNPPLQGYSSSFSMRSHESGGAKPQHMPLPCRSSSAIFLPSFPPYRIAWEYSASHASRKPAVRSDPQYASQSLLLYTDSSGGWTRLQSALSFLLSSSVQVAPLHPSMRLPVILFSPYNSYRPSARKKPAITNCTKIAKPSKSKMMSSAHLLCLELP